MPPTSPGLENIDDATLVRQITLFVAEAADCSPEDVGPDVDLFSELALDSLGIVMVYVDISRTFGIPEPPRDIDLAANNTIYKLAAYARSHAT